MLVSKSSALVPSSKDPTSAKLSSIMPPKETSAASALKEPFLEALPDGVLLAIRPLETTMRDKHHESDEPPTKVIRTIKRASSLLWSPWLSRTLASGGDFVLSAVANGVFEDFGLLLDRA